MGRISVLGVGFDSLGMDEAVETALALIARKSRAYVVTPNPEIVWLCRKDAALVSALEGAALVLPDGVGVTLAAKILGRPLKQRLPGIDFAQAVLGGLAKTGGSVYLLGAKPGVAELAARTLLAQFPGLKLAGARDGYFKDDAPVVAGINAAKPDFLFVCLGAPKQELWMRKNAKNLDAGLMAGLGGALDVFAGTVKRAPKSWQRLGLEWLYRLLREPKRIRRQLVLPRFAAAVIIEGVWRGVCGGLRKIRLALKSRR